MGDIDIDGLLLTPLNIVGVEKGDVLHVLKVTDVGYEGFGEAYFSCIDFAAVKAWKRHRTMTLNLVVPVGKIRFKIHDDREGSISKGAFNEIILSKDNYCRLSIPPMVWVGFQGLAKDTNMLLNIANIPHDPNESDKKPIEKIIVNWDINE